MLWSIVSHRTWVCWGLVRVILVVGLVFLPQNFGPLVGTYEGFLLFCECRWDGDSTWRWWGHLSTSCWNWTCLNFLHWEVVGILKPSLDYPHTLAPLTEGEWVWGQKGCKDARAQGVQGYEGTRAQWGTRAQECKGCEGTRVQEVRAKGVKGFNGYKECKCTRGASAQRVWGVQGHNGARVQGVQGCKGTMGVRVQRHNGRRMQGHKGVQEVWGIFCTWYHFHSIDM